MNEASAWNNAGSFEQRDCTKWAISRVKDLLNGVSVDGITTSSTDVTGDATVIFTRGKRKAGFMFTITTSWKSSKGSGNITITDLTESELSSGDFEVSVTGGQGSEQAKTHLVEEIRKVLEKFYQEFQSGEQQQQQ
eukprot:c2319_g1_i1.p1 GENE.c2319_g1_i1~~c2319_g1_i1.p1  ORF type:complete len:152 (+),score=38.20 c2319_g1_i1:50-457(+)